MRVDRDLDEAGQALTPDRPSPHDPETGPGAAGFGGQTEGPGGPDFVPFEFDGAYGAAYEALARAVIPGYLSSFRQALALLEGRLGEEERFLVVGAGTGIEIVTFRSAHPGWHCTGVDPSVRMITLAQHRISEAGVGGGVVLRNGYVNGLPETPAFTAATCFNVLHFLDDDGSKTALLRDIAIRLEPRAPFVLFDLHGDRPSPEFDELYRAWQAYWRIQGMEESARADFLAELEAGIRWAPVERILELLEEAGFVEVRRFFTGLLYGGWIATRG